MSKHYLDGDHERKIKQTIKQIVSALPAERIKTPKPWPPDDRPHTQEEDTIQSLKAGRPARTLRFQAKAPNGRIIGAIRTQILKWHGRSITQQRLQKPDCWSDWGKVGGWGGRGYISLSALNPQPQPVPSSQTAFATVPHHRRQTSSPPNKNI